MLYTRWKISPDDVKYKSYWIRSTTIIKLFNSFSLFKGNSTLQSQTPTTTYNHVIQKGYLMLIQHVLNIYQQSL